MSAQTTMTMTETAQSLTGFEEVAITKAFGRSIETLANESLAMMGRGLVFVLERRNGADDKTAKQTAMEMPRSGLDAYFPDDPGDEEIDPDNPVTESGKDDEQSA